jgi:uncharacterized protein (DUF58 family)
VFLLSLFVVVPLLGFLLQWSLTRQLELLTVLLFSFIAYAISDFLRVVGVLAELKLNMSLNSALQSGVESEICFRLQREKGNGHILGSFRPIHPKHLFFDSESIEFVLRENELELELPFSFTPLARGNIRWDRAFMRVRSAANIFSWQCEFQIEQPKTHSVAPNASGVIGAKQQAFQRHRAGELLVNKRAAEGREFDSLRQYALGDDLRRVDWKRSSRGRGLMMKVYRPETHQRINIAIDCSRRMGNLIDKRLQLEFATDAASHLVRVANRNADQVGLFAFGHRVLTQVPCRSGPRQEQLLSSKLTELQVGGFEADYQLLSEWAHLNRKRSLLILITSISSPEGLNAIRDALYPVRRKHLPLVFAVADRELEELSLAPAANLDDAYQISAAVEQLDEIRARARQLQREGIDCIYCDVKQLAVMIRERYYSMKASGRL